MAYYLSQPTSVALPADGNFVDVSVRLHRDDSAVPNVLPVATNAEHRVSLLSEFLVGTTAVASSFTEYAIDFAGSRGLTKNNGDLNPVDTRETLWGSSFIVPNDVSEIILSQGNSGINMNASKAMQITIRDSTGSANTISGTTVLTTGQRVGVLWQTTTDGGTGIRHRIAVKIGSGSFSNEADGTKSRPDLDLTTGGFTVGGTHPWAGSLSNWSSVMYGAWMYASGNNASLSIFDSAVQNAFFNSDGTLVEPETGTTLMGVNPRVDTRGLDAAALNAGTNNGDAGNFNVVNGTFS